MTSTTARPQRRSASEKSERPSSGSRTKNSGPRNGLYQKLLAKGWTPKKPYSKLSKLEQSRVHDLRAVERRNTNFKKYEKLGDWVLSIRKRFDVGQAEFAGMVGVSTITVRRYECALGSYPSPATMERLKELEVQSKKRGKA